MTQLFTNNGSSTLASSITSTATSLAVAPGAGALFPAPTGGDHFLLTLIGPVTGQEASWEIVKVTARATDVLTIVRAQESTAAAAWGAGTKVELRATAGTLADKQATLVSGSNIKTINGGSILGGGDIVITGGSSSGPSAIVLSEKTAAYTVVAADLGTIINCTSGTFTVSLTAAATLGSGFNVTVWSTGAGTVTIDPAGSEQIGSNSGNGNSTYRLRTGAGIKLVCDGTFWHIEAVKPYGNYKSTINLGENASSNNNFTVAIGPGTVASGVASTAIGGNLDSTISAGANHSFAAGVNSAGAGSQTNTGAGAMALGGSYASGIDSFAAAITNNTSSYGATGANSIAIGKLAKADSSQGIAIGDRAVCGAAGQAVAIGGFCVASGTSSVAISGYYATASGYGSIAIGLYARATQENSVALGCAAVSQIKGKYAYSGERGFGIDGAAQKGELVLFKESTSGTPVVLSSSTQNSPTVNQVILPNNSAYAFSGTIVARQKTSEGTASAAWEVKGLIRREGSAASTVLVSSALTIISNLPGWGITLTADTTNGGLAITATGAAATNIRFVATISTSELTYA